MKKIYFVSFLFLKYSFVFSNFDNFNKNFDKQEALFKISNKSQDFPNKTIIKNPLPTEAYEYMHEKHKDTFIASKDFITFLKNRSHFNDDEISKQWKLIESLILNCKNKDLTNFAKSMVEFAKSTADLYRYQITAEIQLHPIQIPLTKFEKNYKFKLDQIDIFEYLYIMEHLNITERNHYRSVILKKWARFLLKKITKK